MDKCIAILGATGSVGTQAVDVARARGYRVDFLSAATSVQAMAALCRELSPRAVAMSDERAASALRTALADTDIRVYGGEEGILFGISESRADTVVNAITGEAGLRPSLAVIERGARLALANKETLVIAGEEVMSRARERGVEILPVDSEHCAIFQSLKAGDPSEIKRLLLTASGGPFFSYDREALRRVTLADTLAHPTWRMGPRITVDSATLMNKGFEVIEASHLFGVTPDRIEVVVHRESIIHSAVEYIDNTVIAEMSVPDMRMCVQYAVDYPKRCPTASAPLDLFALGKLTFFQPDTEAFPLLSLASRACALGGGMGAVLNAADEEAVGAFLRERIPFYKISETVSEVFSRMEHAASARSLEDILSSADEARRLARSLL